MTQEAWLRLSEGGGIYPDSVFSIADPTLIVGLVVPVLMHCFESRMKSIKK